MNYLRELNAFYDWIRWIRISPNEIVLWQALMQVANRLNWPSEFVASNEMLQSMTGLCRSTLNEARNRLIQKGRVAYRKGKGNCSGGYRLLSFDCNNPDTNLDTNSSQTRRKPVASTDAPFIQNTININRNINTPVVPDVDMFDRFWSAYPRHTGKEPARKAFAKLKPDEELLRRMLTAIGLQKQSDQWQRDGGQYIPYPATWLNQHRWEDEMELPMVEQDPQPYRYPTPEDDAPYRRSLTGEESLAELLGCSEERPIGRDPV